MQAALAAGFTARQILNFMARMYPSFSQSIQTAATVGYTAEQIVKFLGDNKITNLNRFAKGKSSGQPYPDDPYEKTTNPFIKAAEVGKKQAEIPQSVKTGGKFAAGLGLAALGAYAGNKYANRAIHPDEIQQVEPDQQNIEYDEMQGLPSPETAGREQPGPIPEGPIPMGFNRKPFNQQPWNPLGKQTPQETQENQQILPSKPPELQPSRPSVESTPESIAPQQISAKDLFDKMDISDQISFFDKNKKTPNEIAGILQGHILKPHQLKFLKSETKEPLESLVNRFLQESKDQASAVPVEAGQSQGSSPSEIPKTNQQPNQSTLQPPVDTSALDNAPEPDLSQSKDLTEESEPNGSMTLEQKKREFTPGKHVMMPDGGSGFITDVRGDIAYVKVGDQIKTRKLEDIEDSPLSEEEIGNLWDKLNKNLPKGAKSSHISYAGYDEESNELSYLPHGGQLYTFKNIPREFADKIKAMTHLAKTTGNNLISSWVEGKESRGAGISALISELQKAKKAEGAEDSKKVHEKKDEKLFSHHDYAYDASKRNEKKRRERDKAEAKKRKVKS